MGIAVKYNLKLFRPDPRSCHHQRYCSVPACRAASKVASQAHWLAKLENQDYFRGSITSGGSTRGGRAVRAIGARVDVPALRYKIS
jgi:hypothetical protein